MVYTVSAHDVAQQPWQNGGGLTRELLVWPRPTREGWRLRVSLATIERAGPFSTFAGVERWFVVLRGEGVRLGWAGRHVTVRRGDAPIRFDGADAPACDLLDGPTTDLNFMLRANGWRGALQPVRANEPWVSAARWRALFNLGPTRLFTGMAPAVVLAAQSLAWSEHAAGQAWVCPTPDAWWLHAEPV